MGRQMTRALLFGLVACAYITLAVIKTIPLSRNFTTTSLLISAILS
jgi:hypothetical protein